MKKGKLVIVLLLLVAIIVVGYRLVEALIDKGYVNSSIGQTSVTNEEMKEKEKSELESKTKEAEKTEATVTRENSGNENKEIEIVKTETAGTENVLIAQTVEETMDLEAPTDNIMKYVDTQGTDVIYSSLTLEPVDRNTSYGEIVLHGITTLNGMATLKENGEYEFSDTDIGIFGIIKIEGSSANFTVTDTAVSFVQVGDKFEFNKTLQEF